MDGCKTALVAGCRTGVLGALLADLGKGAIDISKSWDFCITIWNRTTAVRCSFDLAHQLGLYLEIMSPLSLAVVIRNWLVEALYRPISTISGCFCGSIHTVIGRLQNPGTAARCRTKLGRFPCDSQFLPVHVARRAVTAPHTPSHVAVPVRVAQAVSGRLLVVSHLTAVHDSVPPGIPSLDRTTAGCGPFSAASGPLRPSGGFRFRFTARFSPFSTP